MLQNWNIKVHLLWVSHDSDFVFSSLPFSQQDALLLFDLSEISTVAAPVIASRLFFLLLQLVSFLNKLENRFVTSPDQNKYFGRLTHVIWIRSNSIISKRRYEYLYFPGTFPSVMFLTYYWNWMTRKLHCKKLSCLTYCLVLKTVIRVTYYLLGFYHLLGQG